MAKVTDTPRGERLVKILAFLVRTRTFTVRQIHAELNRDEPVLLRNVQRDLQRLAEMQPVPPRRQDRFAIIGVTAGGFGAALRPALP